MNLLHRALFLLLAALPFASFAGDRDDDDDDGGGGRGSKSARFPRPPTASAAATCWSRSRTPAKTGTGWKSGSNGRDVTAAFRRSGSGRLVGLVSRPRARQEQAIRGRARPAEGNAGDHELSAERADYLRPAHHAVHLPDAQLPAARRHAVYRSAGHRPELRGADPDHLPLHAGRRHRVRSAAEHHARCPPNVAMTTTTTGATVRFIVRVETATINRGIYQSAMLHDPTAEPAPARSSPPRGWNRRLIAVEGFGCPGGWYTQGAAIGSLSTGGMHVRLLQNRRGSAKGTECSATRCSTPRTAATRCSRAKRR